MATAKSKKYKTKKAAKKGEDQENKGEKHEKRHPLFYRENTRCLMGRSAGAGHEILLLNVLFYQPGNSRRLWVTVCCSDSGADSGQSLPGWHGWLRSCRQGA